MSGGYHFRIAMRLTGSLRRLAIGLTGVGLLALIFYAEEDWRGWHAWQQFKHEWEASGERFGYQYYVPPPVLEDQNFAMTPIVVSCYGQMIDRTGHEIKPRDTNLVNRLQMSCVHEGDGKDHPKIGVRQKGTVTDLTSWQQYYRDQTGMDSRKHRSKGDEFPVAAQPQMPAADVLLALSKFDPVIEELRQASQRPESRFPLEYAKDNPAAILLPHLAALKQCSQVLQLRAIAELQNHQADRALDDVKLILRLIDSIRSEPTLISQLVRTAILQNALQPVWEGSTEHQWSDAQLVVLDQKLSGLDFLVDYKLAMHGEMAFQDGILRYLRQHPDQFANLNGDGQDSNIDIFGKVFLHLIPSGWFYQNQLHCARPIEKFYLPVADVQLRTMDPTLVRQAGAVVAKECKHIGPYDIMECMLMPALGNAAERFAYAQNSVDLARVACALERHRMARGQYPESLKALVPQYLDPLPHDVIGGAQLIYHSGADGTFQLYSIGWNQTDDGGVSVFRKDGRVDIDKGDWTWQ
jgi:hypothetical protein